MRQSQFDATFATSAPVFKLRGLARVPLQFKRFSVQAVIGMARMLQAVFNPKNMTAAQRKEWRRIFVTGNVVILATAGVSGHPLAMLAGIVIQTLALAMGEPPREWETELEVWLAELFAQEFDASKGAAHTAAATIMRGLPSGLGPVDISKRIGLGDLFVHGKPESMDAKGIAAVDRHAAHRRARRVGAVAARGGEGGQGGRLRQGARAGDAEVRGEHRARRHAADRRAPRASR